MRSYCEINNCEINTPCKIILAAILLLFFINQGCTGEKERVFLSHDFTKKTIDSVFQLTDYWNINKCADYVGKGWSPPRRDENGESYVASLREHAYLHLYVVEKKDLKVSVRWRPDRSNHRLRRITVSVNRTAAAAVDVTPGQGSKITGFSFLIPGQSLELGSNKLVFAVEPGDPGTPVQKEGSPHDLSIRLYDILFDGDPDKTHVFTDCVQDRIAHAAYMSRFTINGEQKTGIAQHPKSAVVFDKCYIPPGASLKFHLGFHPGVKEYDRDVTFSVFVKEYTTDGTGTGTVIFSRTLNTGRMKNNRWTAIDTDLSPFAGKVLSFSFNIRADVDPYTVLAMWGEPRIVSKNKGTKYNVILITMDALRADYVGCYGYRKKLTPNIDRFSRDAVIYKKCWSPAPWTAPSFASFYTSLYPRTHNVKKIRARPNKPDQVPLAKSFPTPPTFFKPYNYSTLLITWHPFFRSKYMLSRDFDCIEADEINGYSPLHIDNIEKWIKRLDGETFFLHIHIMPPHTPYVAVSPFDETNVDPDNPFLKHKYLKLFFSHRLNNLVGWGKGKPPSHIREHISALYKANTGLADEFFGKIIDRLKQSGLYDNSLVILSSDHGEQFWEHGMFGHGLSLHVEELHVPLLIKFPGDFNIPGRTVESSVATIDILPTMLEVNNIPVPGYFHGQPLVNRLTRGLEPVEREYIYLSQGKPGTAYEGVMWRDYKYIHSPVKGTEELYRISTDPFEKNNIAPERPDVVKKLVKSLKKYLSAGLKTVHGGEKGEETPDKKSQEKLKTLGYL